MAETEPGKVGIHPAGIEAVAHRGRGDNCGLRRCGYREPALAVQSMGKLKEAAIVIGLVIWFIFKGINVQ